MSRKSTTARKSGTLSRISRRRVLNIESLEVRLALSISQPDVLPIPDVDFVKPFAAEATPTGPAASAAVVTTPTAQAGTWALSTALPNSDGAETALLRPDGSLMVLGGSGGAGRNWYKLTPDSSGSYTNGTWSVLAPMNTGRLYFGSTLLPDGRVFVLGGEYIDTVSGQAEDNTGEIYDPVANTWTNIPNFPQSDFGDGQTMLLPDGRILAGYLGGPQTYIYDPTTNSWSQTGSKLRGDRHNEESWNKLADGSILSYDIWSSISTGVNTAQRYIPSTGQWVDAGTLPASLSSSANGFELGPGILLPDGRVWVTGANGNSAFYDSSTNSWTTGPVFPNGLAAGDLPAAMLPNGRVLIGAAPPVLNGNFPGPTTIYEFDPADNSFTNVTPSNFSLSGHLFFTMLVLPTGQVALCNASGRLDVYTPQGSPNPAWAPTITQLTYNGSNSFTLTGTQLNGISEGSYYGDDWGNVTNYPIIRLTNVATGQVVYANSYNWSNTGVATGNLLETVQFTVPNGVLPGPYRVAVVANGIASADVGIGMFVLNSSPTLGEIVTNPLSDYSIAFASSVDPATVDATDLKVNGISADSYTLIDSQHVQFHFNTSPVSAQGLQTISMAAGSASEAGDGQLLQPFTSTFRYDAVILSVSSSDPANGSTSTLPLDTITLHFNEAVDPATLSASDLLVSMGVVTTAQLLDPTTARFTVAQLNQEGTLQFSLAAGAVTDIYGNPNAPFNGSTTLDAGTLPYPIPLDPVSPLGGLIYDPPISAAIDVAGDVDQFTLPLQAGQKISFVAHAAAGLKATLDLFDPDGASAATTSASAAGQDAYLQTYAVTRSGTYTIAVGGANSTTGAYQLSAILNAAVEAEDHGGTTNNTHATAQSLAGSTLNLGDLVLRSAAVGTSDVGAVANETEPNGTLLTANDGSGNFLPFVSATMRMDISGAIGVSSDADWYRLGTLTAGDVLTVSLSGSGSGLGTLSDAYVELYRGSASSPILVTSDDDSGPGLDSLINNFAITTTDAYYVKARAFSTETGTYKLGISLQDSGAPVTTGGNVTQETESNNSAATANDISTSWLAASTVQMAISGTIGVSSDADWYRLGTLSAGQILTVSMSGSASSRGTLSDTYVELYRGSAGGPTLVTSDDDGGPGTDSLINNFAITTTDVYYIKARAFSTGTGAYKLGISLQETGGSAPTGGTVTHETESNDSAATANDISTSWRLENYATQIFGSITSGDVDYFKYTFSAGDVVTVNVQSTSTLAARVAILNSAGTIIAQEDGTSTGMSPNSQVFAHGITTTGTYYVRVQASSGVGTYTSHVYLSTNTPPPSSSGDDFYSVALSQAQATSVILSQASEGLLSLELQDASGAVVATGTAGATNYALGIQNFVAPAAGVYYVRVHGAGNVPYSIVVTQGAVFDSEPNDSSSTVSLDGTHGALGALDSTRPSSIGVDGFVLDMNQSVLSLSGDLSGTPLLEQAPGSLSTHIGGTLLVDHETNADGLPGGSTLDLVPQPGLFQPGAVAADFAGQIPLSDTLNLVGVFQNLTFDVSAFASAINQDANIVAPGLPADSVLVTLTGGTFIYSVPGVTSGNYSLVGLNAQNQATGESVIETHDGYWTITIPIDVSFQVIEPTTGLPFTAHLQGQISGTYTLPPPVDPTDTYTVTLGAGDTLIAYTTTPFDGDSTTNNTLDPNLVVLGPGAVTVATDNNSAADHKNAMLTFTASTPGVYTVRVGAESGSGDYVLHVAPPLHVVGVRVQGSSWTSSYLDELQAEGHGYGGYDIPVGSSAQLQTLPWSGLNEITIAFNQDASVSQDSLSVVGATHGAYAFSDFAYDTLNHLATWTLADSIGADHVQLVLAASGASAVTDQSGGPLAGSWTDGVSAFPSGLDGAQSDFNFQLNVLPSDANQDGVVDIQDLTRLANHWLQPDLFADSNGDAIVDIQDLTAVANHWLTTLSVGGGGAAALLPDDSVADDRTDTNDKPASTAFVAPETTSLLVAEKPADVSTPLLTAPAATFFPARAQDSDPPTSPPLESTADGWRFATNATVSTELPKAIRMSTTITDNPSIADATAANVSPLVAIDTMAFPSQAWLGSPSTSAIHDTLENSSQTSRILSAALTRATDEAIAGPVAGSGFRHALLRQANEAVHNSLSTCTPIQAAKAVETLFGSDNLGDLFDDYHARNAVASVYCDAEQIAADSHLTNRR